MAHFQAAYGTVGHAYLPSAQKWGMGMGVGVSGDVTRRQEAYWEEQ